MKIRTQGKTEERRETEGGASACFSASSPTSGAVIREQQTLMFGIDPFSNSSGTRGQGNDSNVLCSFLSLETWVFKSSRETKRLRRRRREADRVSMLYELTGVWHTREF